ncbi:MAG: hypothetical protein K0Q49_1818 [Haloplasmataceae bacterium]|jgi:hypothetical protein|nr:hypothetical protein [Haloplasmataceae bacterium]
MNIKQANDLLNYYKSKLRFLTSLLLQVLPANLNDRLISNYTFKNQNAFNKGFFILRAIVYSIICFTLNYFLNSKNIFNTIIAVYIIISFLSNYLECQKTAHFNSDDHFLQLLGKNKYDYINTQIITKNKKLILYKLIPTTIPLILFVVYNTQLYLALILYIETIVILYFFNLISYYIKLILNNTTLKFSFFFDKLYKSLITTIIFILFIILFLLILIINYFLGSFNLYTTCIITMIYFLFLIIFLIGIKKYTYHLYTNKEGIYKNVKYDHRQISNKSEYPILNKLLFKLDYKQKAIVIKDFKMLIRSKRKEFITYLLLNFVSIYLGILIITSSSEKISDILMTYIYMTNSIICLILTILYFYQKITWFSSESENYYLYYKANISYYKIFKAKLYLNKLLTFSYFVTFILTTFFSIFISFDALIIWLFITVYAYLLTSLLVRTILYYDFVGPKFNLNFDNRSITDKSNLFAFYTLLLFIIPVMFLFINEQLVNKPTQFTYLFLIIIISFLLILNLVSYIKAKSLNKVKRISYGGVDYDQM